MKQLALFHKLVMIGLLNSLIVASSFADQFYTADWEAANWRVQSSRLECRIEQTIPGYGKAIIHQRNGDTQRFILNAWRAVENETRADVYYRPPVWRHEGEGETVDMTRVRKGHYPIILGRQFSNSIINQLNNGQITGFNYTRPNRELITVELLPIDFRQAFDDYVNCLGSLLTYTYNDVKLVEVYFTSDSHLLSMRATKQLRRIRDYVLADPNVTKVQIDGYTDIKGRASINNAVSQWRAKAVAKYLAEMGVPMNRIHVSWHGHKMPVGDNDTPSGKAKNRRVTIKLLRMI